MNYLSESTEETITENSVNELLDQYNRTIRAYTDYLRLQDPEMTTEQTKTMNVLRRYRRKLYDRYHQIQKVDGDAANILREDTTWLCNKAKSALEQAMI